MNGRSAADGVCWLAAFNGRFWLSLCAPLWASIAVIRALRVRFGSPTMGLDVRHALAEGARSMAIVALIYCAGVLALNGVTLAYYGV